MINKFIAKFTLVIFTLIMASAVTAFAQKSKKQKLPEKIVPVEDTIENFDALTDEGAKNNAPEPTPETATLPELDNSDVPNDTSSDALSETATAMPQVIRNEEKTRGETTSNTSTRFIEHPGAAKGLIKIDKDRVYYYKVKPSEQKYATSVRLGVYEPVNLANPDNTDITFNTIYDETSYPMVLYDYERQFAQRFGKLGWKIGAGFYFAQGRGQFEVPNSGGEEPKEKYSLFVFPISVGAIYRFQYFKNQWLIPYVEGGGDVFTFLEIRDDNEKPGYGGVPMAHFSIGGSIAMGKDARSFLDLDREYGINAVFFTAEYRNYSSLSDKFDFSGDVFSAGFTAEY
jgi:hypothetical protein